MGTTPITGDIAYSGKHSEYQTATQWLEELTSACQCEETHVSTIPGNHDCDLGAISHQAKITYGHIRRSTPEQVQAALDGIVQDGEASSPFLPKLKAYRDFANGFGCDFESPARPLWIRDFDLPGGITLRFIGLTSVQVSDLTDAVGTMVLGNQQYTISEHSNVVNIVMVHHPLDWFIEESAATQFLRNNARVVMVGHEHASNVQTTTDAYSKKECLVVSAGAVSPPDKEYNYAYNWLEVSCAEADGKYYLVLEIFPRVWVQNIVRFDADRALLGGPEESVQVRIHCSNLSPKTATHVVGTTGPNPVAQPTIPAQSSPSLSAHLGSLIEPFPAPQGGSPMDTQSVGFDRLRYLFWRYLDWRQRLKVLVDVDVLPHTADQPVPQTMERKALEIAGKTPGKLYSLWEAIMPFVPAEKREQNPFSPLK